LKSKLKINEKEDYIDFKNDYFLTPSKNDNKYENIIKI